VALKIANGYRGWSEHAPFDKVTVTAAPDLILAADPAIESRRPAGLLRKR
jgi:hypothetical protein